MGDNLFGLFFGIIFILIGLIFLSFTVLNIYFNRKTTYWKSLNGKILDSNLTEKIIQYPIDVDFPDSTETRYKNRIRFEYKLGNEVYVSEKIYYLEFNYWFASDKLKKRLSERYRKEKKVTVYLNPKEKNKGFLIHKTPILEVLFYSVLCLSAGIYFILS